jgi:hypothetical protein
MFSAPREGNGMCAACHGTGFGAFFDAVSMEFLSPEPKFRIGGSVYDRILKLGRRQGELLPHQVFVAFEKAMPESALDHFCCMERM